jgi:hypothetical protein
MNTAIYELFRRTVNGEIVVIDSKRYIKCSAENYIKNFPLAKKTKIDNLIDSNELICNDCGNTTYLLNEAIYLCLSTNAGYCSKCFEKLQIKQIK